MFESKHYVTSGWYSGSYGSNYLDRVNFGYLIRSFFNTIVQGGGRMGEEWDFAEYGDDWTEELKQKVKEIDEWTCQTCGRSQSEVHHLVVHHIKSRNAGGKNEIENLVTLCDWCHGHIHRHLRDKIKSSPPTNVNQVLENIDNLNYPYLPHRLADWEYVHSKGKANTKTTKKEKLKNKSVDKATPGKQRHFGALTIVILLGLLLLLVNPVIWLVGEALLIFGWYHIFSRLKANNEDNWKDYLKS